MNISYNWLREYVPTNLSAQKVADLLTFGGLEVEELEKVESVKGGLKNYVIGKVLTCVAHPNSDHLHLTTIDVGQPEPLNIVCGAPNVAAGQTVVVATIGAMVYNGDESYQIKKSKLRGEESCGMLCSERELQFSDNHDGIMVINDPEAKPGTPAAEYFKLKEDWLLEIGLTANRSDATSHIGVGRDLVALLRTRENEDISLQIPNVEQFHSESNKDNIEIKIDSKICPRYSGVVISGIEVKESPKWLKEHLLSIGLRPVNNVVDVTNFVLFEIGQPLHSFDFNKIEGKKIEVKTLDKGTKFITLDGQERELNGKEAMVCNAKEAMCMAGIYGGQASGVSKETTSVFIESAYFNPVVIRKASKYHTLQTDASFRFERGCDPNITIYALKRAALLIQQVAGGQITSDILDVYPQEIKPNQIEVNFKSMFSLIGREIPIQTIREILSSLNIKIEKEDSEGMVLSSPTNKVDVTRQCDIVEEILRIFGYNNVEVPQNVKSSLSFQSLPNKEKIQNIISDYLASISFNEIMNNSLTKSDYYKDNADFSLNECVSLLNPLSKDLALMRRTLLYGGLETVAFNINRKTTKINIFEFGSTYSKNPTESENPVVTKRYQEEKHLLLLSSGNLNNTSWQQKEKQTSFFFIKNIVENILMRIRIDISKYLLEEISNGYVSGLQLVQRDSKKAIVIYGKLSKKVLKQFDIKQDVFYAEFNWDMVVRALSNKEISYEEVAKFPEVKRDLALVIDKDITFAQIEKVAYSTEKKLLKHNINLFDIYEGDKLESGKKQYALSFTLQDKEKTLTDKQIESIMDKLLKSFEKQLGAYLR